jgi:hypothetical protein
VRPLEQPKPKSLIYFGFFSSRAINALMQKDEEAEEKHHLKRKQEDDGRGKLSKWKWK